MISQFYWALLAFFIIYNLVFAELALVNLVHYSSAFAWLIGFNLMSLFLFAYNLYNLQILNNVSDILVDYNKNKQRIHQIGIVQLVVIALIIVEINALSAPTPLLLVSA